MSFYLQKTVTAGPFRASLSRSGIGMSTGVPGLRIGTEPRCGYICVGAHGARYWQTLPHPATRRYTTPRRSPSECCPHPMAV